MDNFLSLLEWLGHHSGALRYTGLPWLTRLWLRRLRGSVMGIGTTFYSSREVLNQRRDFNEFLQTAQNIDAVFVLGQKFITHHYDSFRRIRRLIFPNPESESFKFYAASVGDPATLAKGIIQATKICRENLRIDVRWCPEFIQQSFMIGDADKRSGWAHIELVLPYSKVNLRPSFTIHKSRFEGLVSSYDSIFQTLWDKSTEPAATSIGARTIDKAPTMAMDAALKPLPSPIAGDWILNFLPSSATGRKKITFDTDGKIGEGINQNEWRWDFDNEILSIYRKDDSLQNKFRYERNADRFVCTNDPLALGIKDQTIFRPQLLLLAETSA